MGTSMCLYSLYMRTQGSFLGAFLGKFFILLEILSSGLSFPYRSCGYVLSSLVIPVLVWMHDIDGNGRAQKQIFADEEQFSSALRAMVLVSIILFKAGYSWVS